MKIRSDFVTNSSSSSFVIGYRTYPDDTDNKLQRFYNMVVRLVLNHEGAGETSAADIYYNLNELRKGMFKTYRWDKKRHTSLDKLIEDDSWLKERYEKCVKALEAGYTIAFKYIDYNDDDLENMIREIANFSDDFTIIDSEY